MHPNKIIEAIKERRSIFKFKDEDISKDSVDTILEAGRWAPSFANLQPWQFVVVRDKELQDQLHEIAQRVTIFREGLEEAPVIIAVASNQYEDPSHFVEAGAVATQNMALAAHSLGLSSYWIGIFDFDEEKKSAEKEAKEILDLPEDYRIISLLPVGKADHERTSERDELEEIVIRK